MKMIPEKVASGLSYCTSAGLICAGSFSDWLRHLDWNQIAIVGGFIIGIVTYFTGAYFDWRRTRAYERGVDAGIINQPPEKRSLFKKSED